MTNDLGMIDPLKVRREEAAHYASLEKKLAEREMVKVPAVVDANAELLIVGEPPRPPSQRIACGVTFSSSPLAGSPTLPADQSPMCATTTATTTSIPQVLPSTFDAPASGAMDGSAMGCVSRESVAVDRYKKLLAWREKRRQESIEACVEAFTNRRANIIAGAMGVVLAGSRRLFGGSRGG